MKNARVDLVETYEADGRQRARPVRHQNKEERKKKDMDIDSFQKLSWPQEF